MITIRKYHKERFLFLIILSTILIAFSRNVRQDPPQNGHQSIQIRGVYGNPQDLWQKGFYLPDMGINAVFIRNSSMNHNIVDRAREEGQMVFVEFPVLNGTSYVEEHPEAWAINEHGERVESAGWFMGICPTDPRFRAHRIAQLETLLNQYAIDGIFLDYFHWHAQFEDPHPILPETCFCDRCLAAFEAYTGHHLKDSNTSDISKVILEYHDTEWRDWRCAVLNGWASDFKRIVTSHNPDIVLGLYHCPWDDHEFDGARRNILGLDYDLLREHVDVFSPMVYHARMGRSPEWIRENIEWFSERINSGFAKEVSIWPIIQVHDDPYDITEDEFQSLFLYGAAGDATGIMVFTSASIAEDAEKARLLQTIYLNWSNR